MQDADDRSNIQHDFFYNFVRHRRLHVVAHSHEIHYRRAVSGRRLVHRCQPLCAPAHKNLAELEHLAAEASAKWPKPPGVPLGEADAEPELAALVEERDAASDVTLLFAAMAVEAFLNFYGAVRFGEAEYRNHFERLGLVPKLQQLLLICDSWSIAKNDPLVKALQVVAEGRNELAHPKAWKDHANNQGKHLKPIPGAAQEAVKAMTTFFEEFKSLVPESKHFMPL